MSKVCCLVLYFCMDAFLIVCEFAFYICFLILFIWTSMQANKRTRNRAYEVLVQIGREYGDEDDSGQREHLFNMVLNLLASFQPQ